MKKDSDGGWGLVISAFLIWAIYSIGSSVWNSKARFAFRYGANFSDINKENKPHDCDWLKAPIGDKECHFDAEVQTTKVRTALDQITGRPIISFDDGPWTWDLSSSSYTSTVTETPAPGVLTPGPYAVRTKNVVYVGWKKIDE
jgi:hypothetical protein